jgi:gas vesicle protein
MSTSRFLAGALCGVVVGLLVAPKKGSDLREDIAETADQWKDKFNHLTGRAGATLDELRAILDKNVEGLSEDVKHRILTILDDATELAYSSRSNNVSNGVL